ncbi:iron ABC transporter permease [Leptospira sp. 2 VSF19]|uniref:Iron ABC transporter permease n=1 Tax=Leptospira soteropolitanensis TaxID=2950025 RepID=A0AAW5VDF5_9LEPT|nr:iron ABC transporter permease [Leptospira soteropolitanensis]MCW7492506.1 iron ABC transporter permease [Leptospira soteropolitanensis]MCW7500555.1 iron ABC transporter permease [Leptospira soteropolitanensis]MCW7522775.1 iron ABC transporter permease [Leptospira soteropolitanensis]MCW7526632.1 iron ABC transporter permease [Leptospira soteropolitanensis]MCW7530525.1 iron ABC transporter permease [Leptospira soteropolitanensis]
MKKKVFFILSCLIFTIFSAVLSSLLGAMNIRWEDLIKTDSIESRVFFELRIPRIILGTLVGGSLAWSGALAQGLFRNPIVDPGLIGITAGCSLFASIAIVLGTSVPYLHSIWSTVVFSFLGGISSSFIIFFFAKSKGRTDVFSLLLSGIAVNAICFSAIGILSYIANEAQLRNLSLWNMGSLGGASWSNLKSFSVFFILPLFISPLIAKQLNVFILGEREANHLGVSTEFLKTMVILLIGVSVGACISLVGNIGFVGLAVPHIVRLAIGQDYRYLLLTSYLLGGGLLCLADGICRIVISPSEIPVGIATALLGAPFFLSLIRKRMNHI